jgi:DNA primase
MARVPESEIERLKLQVSVVSLVEAAGIQLKPHGKDLVGRCPFHDDKTPSLVVSPKSNLWHCLGKCQMGGSAIDWVMRFEGVSFRRAVDLLLQQLGAAPSLAVPPANVAGRARAGSGTTVAPNPESSAARPAAPEAFASLAADAPVADAKSSADTQAAAVDASTDADQALLRRVIEFYHQTLKRSPEALAYLAQRGLTHPEVVDHFKLGFCNRTLGYRLPNKRTVAREAINAQLQRIGIYRASMREHLDGSLVIPVLDLAGNVTEAYGRKITRALRAGTPRHVYLPGPHRGVFNEVGLVGQAEIILCEALLDALTFWCAGYRNVTSSYGIEGFTPDLLAALKRHGVQRVLIAYDADEAGNAAAVKLAKRLAAEGFACWRCVFPKGMDANAYALSVQPAAKALGLVLRQAQWLGEGEPPLREAIGVREDETPATSTPTSEASATVIESPAAAVIEEALPIANVDVPSLVAELEAAKAEIPTTTALLAATPAIEPAPSSSPAALPVTLAPSGELSLTLGDRLYRVRGIEKNLSYDQLKVLVRASRSEFEHIDQLEFYVAKQRAAWIKAASVELGLGEDVLKADLAKLLHAVEQRQDQIIRRELKPATPTPAEAELEPALRDDALALLRDPNLAERIVADIEACGVVGEGANALVGYLACVSRKLDKPLAIIVQSTSAAGKSTLMDALLALMPEAERVHYSAMTGQSLFYLGEGDLQHKILAIAEEEGVRQAAYALKLLQSQGELTIASTGKDPATGKLVTEEYRVRGPVMLLLTTTAIDVDEELLNRCLVLTINESREQTRAIHQRQRQARTLAGVLATKTADAVRARHQAAQQLLRPLLVVNPYAEALTFRDESTRLRRDHQKYLTLIDAIALLHQHQRPLHRVTHAGRLVEYIEVTPDDIALANRLANAVLGRSLDELPPQTRRLLGTLTALVGERSRTQAIERSLVRFTRREVREASGLSDTQARIHLDRLVALEYVLAHSGRNGQRFSYELLFDGDAGETASHLPGLIEGERLVALAADAPTTTNLAGVGGDLAGSAANLAGRLRPARGPLAGTSRGPLIPLPANADAACGDLFAIDTEIAAPRPRLNGVSHEPSSPVRAEGSSRALGS